VHVDGGLDAAARVTVSHRFDSHVGRARRRNGSNGPLPVAGFLATITASGWGGRVWIGRLRWRHCPTVRASFGYSRRSRRRRSGTRMLQRCWRYSSGPRRGMSRTRSSIAPP
jgi:hypothetical protein